MFGFGDNERAQLGHDTLRGCLQPTEIFVQETADDTDLASEGKWRSSLDTLPSLLCGCHCYIRSVHSYSTHPS